MLLLIKGIVLLCADKVFGYGTYIVYVVSIKYTISFSLSQLFKLDIRTIMWSGKI
jgi:hypothetical protein